MTMQSPVALGLAALILTACAVALGGEGSAPTASPIRGAAGQPAFRCALATDATGGGTAVTARLDAREAVAGTYALRVRSGGAVIDQGGDFSARAGETVTLGEATLGGSGAVEGDLTVTAGGRTTTCPMQRS